jgi:vesicle coat complex subunit
MDLINTRVSYVVQEAVVVMKVRCCLLSCRQSTILIYGRARRISSANTLRHTKASSRRCALTSKSSTSRRRKPRSSGSLASTQRRSTMPSSSLQYLWIRLGMMHTLCVPSHSSAIPRALAILDWVLMEGQVQLQTLTAVVKSFLKRPDQTQALLQRTLDLATKCDSPDVRDRAYIYWRLLSTDAGAARVCSLGHSSYS